MPVTNQNFIGSYIRNVPWAEHSQFAFTAEPEEYVRSLEALIDTIPSEEKLVDYQEDRWDFNQYYPKMNDSSLVILFTDLPEPIKKYCKFFAIHEMFKMGAISTVSHKIAALKTLFTNLYNEGRGLTINTIGTDDLVNFVEERETTHGRNHLYYRSFADFYDFITYNYRLTLPVDISKLNKLAIEEKKKHKKFGQRLPNIPDEYFLQIKKAAKSVMLDESLSHNDRATACVIILLSQLGMRIDDVLGLTEDALITETFDGLSLSYIYYEARKPSKSYDKLLKFKIVANELTIQAFKTLCSLAKAVPKSERSDFIVTLIKNRKNDGTEYPIVTTRMGKSIQSFFRKYLSEECHKPWEGIGPAKIYTNRVKGVQQFDTIYVPDSRQYRVYVCTYYYEHGVPLTYIKKFMGHLTDYMLGYYVRMKDDFEAETEATEKVIRSIVFDDNTPIGYRGEELKKRIEDFISERNITVADGIEEIVKTFGDRVIIRSKMGGSCVCIKTTIMPCKFDARSNEILCACGDCVNIYRFYHQADSTYMDFMAAKEIYRHDISAGRKREAQKELSKLKDICKNRLIPQLDEMDKELVKSGKESILTQYPSLEFIINNESSIREDIATWMKM